MAGANSDSDQTKLYQFKMLHLLRTHVSTELSCTTIGYLCSDAVILAELVGTANPIVRYRHKFPKTEDMQGTHDTKSESATLVDKFTECEFLQATRHACVVQLWLKQIPHVSLLKATRQIYIV